MTHEVVLIPGDGIGPEVAAAPRMVLDATGVDIGWEERPAGAGALETDGALLPASTLEAIRRCRTAIKGPITTPVGEGFRSINVALRQDLDLFAADLRHTGWRHAFPYQLRPGERRPPRRCDAPHPH